MKKNLIVAAVCVLMSPLYAAEIIPVGEINFSGGTSFFEGESSASGGNFNIAAVPVIKFSEDVVLMPGYYGNYRGSKSVYELLGGGTLYRDSMSHNFTLRLINKLSPAHKFKLKTGYVFNYFRETTDEDWGDGLFDFQKFTLGIESEVDRYMGMDKVISSFDILKVRFPEYASLASARYGQEVFPGTNILDFSGINLYFRGLKRLSAETMFDANINFMLKDFPEQNVINSQGEYTLTKRSDRTSSLDMIYSRLFGSFSAGFSLGAVVNRSNQDHYDASEYKFVEKYYDYDSYSAGPVISYGDKLRVSCAYKYGIRNYSGRLAQKTNSDYTSSKVKNTTHFVSLGSSYRLSEKLRATASANYFSQDSNQDYEAVYKYNYDTYNLDVGFVYEF